MGIGVTAAGRAKPLPCHSPSGQDLFCQCVDLTQFLFEHLSHPGAQLADAPCFDPSARHLLGQGDGPQHAGPFAQVRRHDVSIDFLLDHWRPYIVVEKLDDLLAH